MEAHSNPDMASLGRLIPISDVKVGAALVPTCNARELHAFMEVRREFSNWIKARILKYGFVENVDYAMEARPPELASGNRGAAIDYHLTLDTAKELAMVENNTMGRQVRRYFIECERRGLTHRPASVNAPIPTDPAWAEWLCQSTDERRTRQRDILIGARLYGSAGGRYAAHQVGYPLPPRWVLSASQQHELELARQNGGVTVMVNVPNGSSH